MTYIKNFNLLRFFILVFLIGILTALSFITAFGKDEGTLGNNVLLNFVADCFYVFRFPMHVLFWKYMRGSAFISGLLINVVFYAVLVETFISALEKKELDQKRIKLHIKMLVKVRTAHNIGFQQ